MNKRQLDAQKIKDSDWKSYNQLTQRERMKFRKTDPFSWYIISTNFFKNNEEGD